MEKKIRDIFFDMPIDVRQSLVMLPALAADSLFVDVLLGANWIKYVGACLDINRIELFVDKEKLRFKKLPDPSEDFVELGSICTPVNVLRLLLAALQYVKLSTVLSRKKSFALLTVKLDQDLCSTSLNSQIKTALSTHLASEISLSCQKLSSVVKKLGTCNF